MNKIKEFVQSKMTARIIISIVIFLVVIIIFQAGMFAGYRKATFSYRSGDNFYRTFGEERQNFKGRGMMGEFFSNPHGAIGKIVTINLPKLIIGDRDGVEKEITLDDDTTIRRERETLAPSDLKENDLVMIVGSPNENSEIEAKLIRLLPMEFSTSTKANFIK